MNEKQYEKVTTEQVLNANLETCACCGKKFYIPIYCPKPQWKYKLLSSAKNHQKQRQLWCCSWSCFNKLKYPKSATSKTI